MKKALVFAAIALIGLGMWMIAMALTASPEAPLPAAPGGDVLEPRDQFPGAQLAAGFALIGGGVLALIIFGRR